MINEESKPRIAIDFINNKIAKTMHEIRKTTESNLHAKLQSNLNDLLLIKEQINVGNYEIINKVLDRVGGEKND